MESAEQVRMIGIGGAITFIALVSFLICMGLYNNKYRFYTFGKGRIRINTDEAPV
jgi:hypothetical protein